MSSTLLNVTACNNELYIIASSPYGSSEVCHIQSGYNQTWNYSIDLSYVLQPGTYNLTMIGITWGGSAAFTVAIGETTYQATSDNAVVSVGLYWTESVTVTIPPAAQ